MAENNNSKKSVNDQTSVNSNIDLGKLKYSDLLPVNEDAHNETRAFLERVASTCIEHVQNQNDRKQKVIDFCQPDEMLAKFDFSIGDEPMSVEQLLADCQRALKLQVKTGHPHFFNQLSNGLDVVSMAGEWLTATANTNMFTYEIAPVFILMEHQVLGHMRKIIGFQDGDSILSPGGAIANMYSLLVARHTMFPEHKTKGMRALPQDLVMFTSEHSHYSSKGAGASCGLGTDNVIEVACDERGRMRVDELERHVLEAINAGKRPFYVNCTCGTTVLGAFDPVNLIADLCAKYNMWLHIDAAWGGGCLLSRRWRQRLAGCERADSLTWNPHKLMSCVLQCSTVHFKRKGLLMSCNQMCADYLFQQDKQYDVSYDTGDKVIQCGRHNDIFKLWLMWRSKGALGFEQHIDHLFEMTAYQVEQIKRHSDRFMLLWPEPDCTNVCFWYLPRRMRDKPRTREWELEMGSITAQLKAKMMEHGTLMIGYQPLGETPNFFRSIISNAAVQRKDIDFMLAELDRLGADM